jgi:hypothetical protein
MQPVRRRGRGRAEGFFQEGDAHPLGAPHLPERGRGPRLALDHLGEQGQPHRDDLAVLGQAGHRLVEEPLLLGRPLGRVGGEPSEGPAELRQDLAGVARVEQVHGGEVVPLDDADFQVAHEPGRGHAEVVADQGQALHVLSVALPQGLDQLGVLFRSLGVQPLLELVENQQDLEAARSDRTRTVGARRNRVNAVTTSPAPPQLGEGFNQPEVVRQSGAALAQPLEQSGLGFVRRGLDVYGVDLPRQPGQQPGLDQRRLAATARPVQQADAEGLVRVCLLDAPLPEAEAVGQAVAVARAGQQLQKEIGVGRVVGAQALGNDLDRQVVRCGAGDGRGHGGESGVRRRRRHDLDDGGRTH